MTARRRPGSVTDWRATLPCGICPPLLAPSVTAQSARRAPPVYSGSRWRTGPVRGASHDRDQDVFIHSGDGQLAPHQGPVPLPAGVGQRAPSRMCAGAPGLAHGVGGAESPSGCRETSVRGPLRRCPAWSRVPPPKTSVSPPRDGDRGCFWPLGGSDCFQRSFVFDTAL